VGSGTVLTGSARLVQEAKDRAQVAIEAQEFERNQRALDQERIAVESQIADLQERLQSLKNDFAVGRANKNEEQARLTKEARELAFSRNAEKE
jgi:circadian clock protein KaiC